MPWLGRVALAVFKGNKGTLKVDIAEELEDHVTERALVTRRVDTLDHAFVDPRRDRLRPLRVAWRVRACMHAHSSLAAGSISAGSRTVESLIPARGHCTHVHHAVRDGLGHMGSVHAWEVASCRETCANRGGPYACHPARAEGHAVHAVHRWSHHSRA